MSSIEKKHTYKLPHEYENYECDDEINQDEHNAHLAKFKNQYFDSEVHMESLKKDINELHENISKIQARHHSDYISTFNQFMETVKFDIKDKIHKMDAIQEEKERDENILKIVTERNLFREEAIRLNIYNKTLASQLEQLKRKMREKEDDFNAIYKKWQQSEVYNQQLISELNNSISTNQKLLQKLEFNDVQEKPIKDAFLTNVNFKQDNGKNEGLEETESFDNFKRKCLRIINKLKEDLKKEKIKTHKNFQEMSSISLEQKKLEKIFVECVELVQNDIKHRKELELLSLKQTQSSKAKTNDNDLFSFDTFLTQDKKKLIINFFLSNEIINLVHDSLCMSQSNNLNSTAVSNHSNGVSIGNHTATEELFHKTSFERNKDSLVSNMQQVKTPPLGLSFNITSKIRTKGMKYYNS